MHCPRCGQQQPSDIVRFCSRCGFHLGVVAELLHTNGLMTNELVPGSERAVSPRRAGVTLAAKLLFAGVILVPVAILFGLAADTPAFLIAPATLFFLGLARILYAVAFEAASLPAARGQRPVLVPVNPPKASVTGEVAPMGGSPGRISPESVTEQTTHLLDHD